MPLTHVCMWSGHGWKRITVDEAVKMRPGGTVSARSGLFMCDLCGQYVTLAYGDIRDPYFKHSSEEKSKNCPERTFATSTSYEFQATAHTLPLRLRITGKKSFSLEIGFVSVPSNVIGKLDERKIVITGAKRDQICYQYSFSRLQPDSITYLSVGSKPSAEYHIKTPVDPNKIGPYWPEKIEGLSGAGTLFDSRSGKRLPEDADVRVGYKYYLVTTHEIGWLRGYRYMRIEEICTAPVSWLNTWHVYQVEATAYEEDPARFFLDYHARLTEHPINLFPIWPVFVERPYIVLHKSTDIYVYLEGDEIRPKMFPYGHISSYQGAASGTSLLSVRCQDRQQLLSAGRSKVLKYMYLWKDELSFHNSDRQISVKDTSGNDINPGTAEKTPTKGLLLVQSEVDGFAEVIDNNGFIINKVSVPSDTLTEIDSIRIGATVRIYKGLDCVWQIQYIKPKKNRGLKHEELLDQLKACRGERIPVSHALISGIAIKINDEEVTHWLNAQLRNGYISKDALRVLGRELLRGTKNEG